MAPQHSFIAGRIDNTFCTSMKGWNKMFIAVIIVEVCICGNTPGKLLDSIVSLCCNILTWSFLKCVQNYVVCISRESYALWNFLLNYPYSWGNLRIHCFPGSLLMFKCCFAVYSELFSYLDYFSLLRKEKLAFTCGSKTEVVCQIPVATTAISDSHYCCCCERIRCRTEGISDTEVLLQCSQRGSISDLIAPTDSNLLASHPKLPITSLMPYLS